MAQHDLTIEEALGLSHAGVMLDDKEDIGGMGHAGVMLDDKEHIGGMGHPGVMLDDEQDIGGMLNDKQDIGGMGHEGVMLDDKELIGRSVSFGHRSILMNSHSSGSLDNHLHTMQVEDSCLRPDSVHGHTLSSVRPVGSPDPGLLSNIFQDPPSCPEPSCLDPPSEPLNVPLPPLRLSDQIVPATSYIDSTFHLYTTSSCQLNSLNNLTSSSCNSLNNLNSITNLTSNSSCHLNILDPPLTSTVTLTIPDFTSLSPPPSLKRCEDVRLSVLAKSWTEDLTGYLSSGLWADVEIRCGETDLELDSVWRGISVWGKFSA